MPDVVVAHSAAPDAATAGAALGNEVQTRLGDARPDAAVVFASSRYDHRALLRALVATCTPAVVVGCSSAGEFTDHSQAEGSACVLAIRAPEMRFRAAIGRGLRGDRAAAAQQLAEGLQGGHGTGFRYRTALLLADALAGHTDDFVQELTRRRPAPISSLGVGRETTRDSSERTSSSAPRWQRTRRWLW